MRLLYKDEKEDVYSELYFALWEAVDRLSDREPIQGIYTIQERGNFL